MIEHIVMLRLRPGHDRAELAAVMEGLGGLIASINGYIAFRHGPNRDFERLSPGLDYGFVCSFRDTGALADYAGNPEHRALGARLVALCGGVEGIMVIDLDTAGD